MPLVLSCLFALSLTQYPGSTPVPADVKKGFDAISVKDAKRWLGYLAGPECLGRGSGQPGYQKAAEYVAARFKEMGLKPAGENDSYFQYVPFMRYRYNPSQTSLTLPDGGFKGKAEKDFVVTPGSKDLDVTASIAFIRAKGNPDLGNLESAKGRVVVLWIEDGYLDKKLLSVIGNAVYTFVVVDKVGRQAWRGVPNTSKDFSAPGRPRLGYINLESAKRLASELRIDKDLWQKHVPLNTYLEAGSERQVHLEAKAQSEPVGVPNVIGILEGSDPALKGDVVAVGAHLDHMGSDGYTTWWGADDNGSGCAALLGAANAFAKNGKKPRRSVLFMAFCGEELGMVGSEYFVGKPTLPLDNFACYMNLDMVGRDSSGPQLSAGKVDKVEENADTMRLIGLGTYGSLVRDLNRYVGFKLMEPEISQTGGSDHTYFLKKGVPITFLFCGFTPDYHKPSDTLDKVDFTKIVNASRLAYLSLMRVGSMEGSLKRD